MEEQAIDKPMMASELIAALSNPKRNLGHFHNHKYANGMVQKLRVQLVQSKKFVIDDSLLYNLVQASMVKPKAFLKAIELAKPPFPNMFIEFSEKSLFRAYKKFYATQYPALMSFISRRLLNTSERTRKGYHILSDDETTEFMPWYLLTDESDRLANDKWFTSPKSVRVVNVSDKDVDFERRVKDITNNKDKFTRNYKYRYEQGQVNGADMVTMPGISFFGEDYFHYYSERFAKGVEQRAEQLSEIMKSESFVYGRDSLMGRGYNKSICHRVASQGDFASICSKLWHGNSYAWDWSVPQKDIEDKVKSNDKVEQDGFNLAYEFFNGEIKFLIAALAMFNFDHIIYKKKTRGTTKLQHISRGQKIPFNEYSLMTIELPKPRGVQKYEREFTGHGSPKCEHWRCGHWRRYRDRFGNVTKRTWIKAKKVGNKAYGTKQTEYKLNKAQGE
tara:strand:- start:5780 stop:7117 length:1338 start_codon:yes stop_codon:yes gene_type:complete